VGYNLIVAKFQKKYAKNIILSVDPIPSHIDKDLQVPYFAPILNPLIRTTQRLFTNILGIVMEKIISECLVQSQAALNDFVNTQKDQIILLTRLVIDTIKSGNKLLIFGNGGSAADAQHMAAEFVNRFLIDRPPLAAIALTTDSSILTSIGNDFSFDDIFSKQITALGAPGDLALGISTSGNSPNVINAIKTATDLGLKTAVLTGGSGGSLVSMADINLNVPCQATPHIQETHIWVEHLICRLVDEELFGNQES